MEAKKVVNKLKQMGWSFASHSYFHLEEKKQTCLSLPPKYHVFLIVYVVNNWACIAVPALLVGMVDKLSE